MLTNKDYKMTLTNGSHKATVTTITDGYGDKAYRVKVTYNNEMNMAFLRNYSSEKTANSVAKRELSKIS